MPTPLISRPAARAQFLADILTTAVEGGIQYWAHVDEYRWWSPTLDGGTAEHADGTANAYARITDLEVESGERTITVDDIARALRTISKHPITGMNETTRRLIIANDHANGDAEHFDVIDADSADAIVQVALYGEVVYG
ncbi:MAG: hypothetical protein JWM93_730 [Frankiales bacterium]|nr:hypothetical protein [Frankiales bacterium]